MLNLMKKYNQLQQKHSYPRVSSLTFPIYSAIAIARRFALLLQSLGENFRDVALTARLTHWLKYLLVRTDRVSDSSGSELK